MATRYLAILNMDNSGRIGFKLPPDMGKVFGNETLSVFVDNGGKHIPMGEKSGVLIGDAFTQRPSTRLAALSSYDARQTAITEGSHLLKSFWGGYIALWTDAEGVIRALRDPSGTMPCYIWRHECTWLLSSDIETLQQAVSHRWSVDWDNLHRFLFAHDLRTERTCIEGLDELLAGHMLTFGPKLKVTKRPIWSPWDYVTRSIDFDATDQAERLNAAILDCVKAWAGGVSSCMASVSGGLDSSIVAHALSAQQTPWFAMTMATDEPVGDERRYARQLANYLGQSLDECFHSMADVDVRATSAAHLPRPIGNAFGQSQRRIALNLAKDRGAQAIFNGIGGDNVFCFMQSATPLLDRLKSEGYGRGALETLLDICDLTGASVWEVSAMAFNRARRKSPAYPWAGDDRFLCKSTPHKYRTSLTHPWLSPPEGAHFGKAVHIAMLVRIQATMESYSRFEPLQTVYPLLSQPVVELCLAVPTWEWCRGGRDRSLARSAFQYGLPNVILDRASKGGPDSFGIEVIAHNRQALRELLLDGLLQKNGLIDRGGIEQFFCDRQPIKPPDHVRIARMAEAEVWARHWAGLSPPSA